MLKAGAVYQKRFTEWFQPLNTAHLSAYLSWKATGRWPKDVVPDLVWFPAGWQEEVEKMVANMPVPPQVQAFTDELTRVSGIVSAVSFPGRVLTVDTLADHFCIQVQDSGIKWAFPSDQTEEHIVRMCFNAIRESLEYQAQDNFLYQGRSVLADVLQSHLDMLMVVGASPRSGKWPKVRETHLEKNPVCIACGAKKPLNVHHVRPYHLHPDLELEPTNLVTLCESASHNCHFIFGHFLNWSRFNPRVIEMCLEYFKGYQDSLKGEE